MGVLRSGDGRLRLGWRLLLFVMITAGLTWSLALVFPPGVVWGSLALLLGAVGAGVWLLRWEGRPASELGFPRDGALRGSLLGLGLGVGVASVAVLAIFAAGGVTWVTEPERAGGWWAGAVGALAFLALPAAAEEALVRGYPLRALAEAWGDGVAVVVTSVVFASLHLGNPSVGPLPLLNITAAGLFLGALVVRAGNLWWATGAHLGWNWAHGYLADLPVSGLELLDAPGYEGWTRGPTWLGGGAFGPEGSAVTTLVVVVAAAAVWRAPRRLRDDEENFERTDVDDR